MPDPSAALEPLADRKRRLVRQRIIEASDELFAARGFDNVSVSDIAARADVGRTTFFRYFGDKQEVVFAQEQQMLDAIAEVAQQEVFPVAQTAIEAVEQLRPIVVGLCERATADLDAYARHRRLLEQHLELRGREALKIQQIGVILGEILRDRGTDEATAVFASQVALACYQTGQRRAKTPASLADETRAAFDQAARLGQRSTPTARV
ncbi:TetR family transcriptional regulator [Pseudoclavibacter endophyticus]|uniref:TetR/AcrR family transcriptional regulator n=1 Tax=Pseudoclavibacter endophyticus TaxID=1778590 RepID=A0A6H9WDN8_9MICO|nr:TetR/AcrR family transcriptional regulator [Pseudoclavibacter endophyticus]KAB1649039.1 TetR/AcrR family transcriptional regulator [Pseudoclavibacter endophyticus]GGA65997.1 TetR family transcriptional regulator [Pseudoclavibacter endophyticus]